MSGMASDRASTDASDPVQPDIRHPDTFASRTPESASSARERVARQFEPGQNQSTTRRLSDTVSSMRHQFQEASRKESGGEASEQNKSMLDRSHETLAKALGGGSRGTS